MGKSYNKKAAYEIIEKKGYTYLAIGLVIARIFEGILDYEKSVIQVSMSGIGSTG